MAQNTTKCHSLCIDTHNALLTEPAAWGGEGMGAGGLHGPEGGASVA